MITFNVRCPDVPPADDQAEARALLAELAGCEIYLRVEGDRLRWKTRTPRGISISQLRALKRLDHDVKALVRARTEDA